jgi:hypothetical protein
VRETSDQGALIPAFSQREKEIRICSVSQRMNLRITRRDALIGSTALLGSGTLARLARSADQRLNLRLATFSADVTPRLGHPLFGGLLAPARSIDDPLFAKGMVLLGPDPPIVLVAVDWCEIRNDAYARWRDVLAESGGTSADRVLVTSVHQHDAPLADLAAQRLLDEAHVDGKIIDLDFHERTVQRVAAALKESLRLARQVTHFGLGQAKVEHVASNRRVVGSDGKASFARYSATRDAALRDLPEGLIDPWLKVLSFWDGREPLAAVNAYATHPMSYYGGGAISSDFVGLARAQRQQDDPSVHQIYVSGCSGDVTAGKYNDGSPENRQRLAERMHKAMTEAWKATKRHSLSSVQFRNVSLRLPHREGSQTEGALRAQLADTSKPMFARALAAMGLSSRQRSPSGHQIDIGVLDLGAAQMVLLPGESLVGYQLMAQKLRPDCFVLAIGYGECSPGYIPTDEASREGYAESQGWCWVAPDVEKRMADALGRALNAPTGLAK